MSDSNFYTVLLEPCLHYTSNFNDKPVYSKPAYTCHNILKYFQVLIDDKSININLDGVLQNLLDSNFMLKGCYLHHLDRFQQILLNLLKLIESPSNSILRKLIRFKELNICFPQIIHNNPNIINNVVNCIKNELLGDNKNIDSVLIDILLNNISLNNQNTLIKQLCSCDTEYLNQNLASIIEKSPIVFTQDFLIESCIGLPKSIYTVTALINKGLSLDDDCFKKVSDYGNESGLDMYIRLINQPISKTQFKYIIEGTYKKYSSHHNLSIPEVPVARDSDNNKYNNKLTREDHYVIIKRNKIETLFLHGYIPDKEDIILSIVNGTEIPNLKRFGIILDKEVFKVCHDQQYYPNYEFQDIPPELIELAKLTLKKDIKQIRQFRKKNPLIIPDYGCMQNASEYIDNAPILKYLIDMGGKVNFKCIRNHLNGRRGRETTHTILIDNYEKNNTELIETYKQQIQELKQRVHELESNT